MNLRLFFIFIKDLFDVLPSRTKDEWEKVDELRADLPTVILVSGFAATRRSLSVIRKRFQRDGYNVLVLAMDWHSLADGIRGLIPMALRLSTLILNIKKDKTLAHSPIYLVAHSAGGLVARYYVQVLGGSHYTEGLVTLGTPHKGTWVAALGLFTHLILKAKCLWDMTPWSGLIAQLNTTAWPQSFPLLTVQSKGDYVSYPSAGQLPEKYFAEESGLTQKKVIAGLSHSELLLSKRAYYILLEEVNRRLGLTLPPKPSLITDSN